MHKKLIWSRHIPLNQSSQETGFWSKNMYSRKEGTSTLQGVGFNSMPNLIVILFNMLSLVFYMGFHCKGCVWERVWRLKANWRPKNFSRVAREKPSREVKHVLSTWLECEESWQLVTVSFRECLMGKAFPQDTRGTFCFANLSYMIH